MGARSVLKYLAICKVAATLVTKGLAWLENARDEDGPGGEEVTPEEYFELFPILEEAIVEALGLAVEVRISPKEEDGG